MQHHYQDLIAIFNTIFLPLFNTQLVNGSGEPIYIPGNKIQPNHTIFFANDFYSSALHECAHWCIAGERRRLLEDYGYWYLPDGRTSEEQMLFQAVEVKPQAIELLFSLAANYQFQFSLDNLNGNSGDLMPFKQAVYEQALHYNLVGLPKRAQIFYTKLCDFYQTSLETITAQLTALYKRDFPAEDKFPIY